MTMLQQPSEQGTAPEGITIVIVEDDFSNAQVLEMLLQTEPFYRVISFSTGREVLQHLEEGKAPRPDLFIIDYHLRHMLGLDLYDQLCAIEGLEQVPAILITADTVTEDILLDAVKHEHLQLIYKPYDIDDLLAAIRQATAQDPQAA